MLHHPQPNKDSEAAAAAPLLDLYPEIEPYHTGTVRMDELHTLYYEQSGNPEGVPVIFLHGGPGGGTDPKNRRFFDPQHYRIILMDQRGCGKSSPVGETRNNTTELLVDDIERLRRHLGIARWHVFGGSWGSTLALCYAIAYPAEVLSLALRGIFMMREKEIDWFVNGVKAVFPEAWHTMAGYLTTEERKDILGSFYKRLHNPDLHGVAIPAARIWSAYEIASSRLIPKPFEEPEDPAEADKICYAIAKIETHYFIHNRFQPDNYILQNIGAIRHIPTAIVQGRYDMVCPAESAYELHQAFPEAELCMIPDAGHSSSEPGITDALIKTTNHFRFIMP